MSRLPVSIVQSDLTLSQRSDRRNQGTAKSRCHGYVREFRFKEALLEISLLDKSLEPKIFLVSKM